MLRRTVGILARVTDGPVVVVRAPGQDLPAPPPQTEVVEDPREGLGPVQGLAAGLAVLKGRAEVAFVSSTDMRFLHPPSCAGSCARRRRVPMSGCRWRGGIRSRWPPPTAWRWRRWPRSWWRRSGCGPRSCSSSAWWTGADEDALRADPAPAALDPGLDSVVNVNEPADYQQARERPAPKVTIQRFGPLADGHRGPEQVLAATVAEAAAAAGLDLDRHVVAALNGDQITRDGETPLATGDTVFFLSADAGG